MKIPSTGKLDAPGKNTDRPLCQWLFQALVMTCICFATLELFCMFVYFYQRGEVTRPTYIGGEPLLDITSDDDYEFNPLTLFVNKDVPANEGLFAKGKISLPPKQRLRVFLLGGSTVANLRKPRGDRISDHLQKELENGGLRVDVFNFGVPSYTSLNEMYLALSTLVYLDPDLIIFYDGVNDAHMSAISPREDWQPNFSTVASDYKSRLSQLSSMSLAERAKNIFRIYSYTYYQIKRFVRGGSGGLSSGADFGAQIDNATRERIKINPVEYANRELERNKNKKRLSPDYDPLAASVYIKNIRFTASALEKEQISFLHVIQPTALTKKILFERERWSIDYNNSYYGDYQGVLNQYFERYGNEQRKMANDFSSRKIRFLNLNRLTDDYNEPLFDDFCHALRDGRLTEIVGRKLGEFILSEELLRK